MTDGSFIYSSVGKIYKKFGPDDSDALKILSEFVEIHFISADKKGFEISKKRISDDMGFNISLVPTFERIKWIDEKYKDKFNIYMGDGIFDFNVMKNVDYSISPNNSFKITIEAADFCTTRNGGDRAVAEACLHIMEKFFVNIKFEDKVYDLYK